MIFKGIKWRKVRKIVTLPESFDVNHHIKFGKMCDKACEGAIKTKWNLEGEEVYAKEIPNKKWSLTNMMYGLNETVDGDTYSRAYLFYKGQVYTARWKREKV